MEKLNRIAWLLAALTLTLATAVRADVATVNKYLDEATELIGKGGMFADDATAKLDLADASMDDVPAEQKAALKAKIDGLRTQIQNAAGSEDKARIQRKLDSLLADVESAIGNAVIWPGKSDELAALLNDPKTTAALGEPAVTAAKKKFAVFTKVNGGKALTQNLANAKQFVADLQQTWTEQKADIAANGVNPNARDRTQDGLEQMPRYFKDLPPDNADVKTLLAQVETIKSERAAALGGAAAAEQAKRIDSYLDMYKDDFAGMDSETTPPTWADFAAGKEPARSLGTPKTQAYVRRMADFATDLEKGENYADTKNDPTVKGKVDAIKAKVAAGQERIKKNCEGLVAGLEAEKVNAQNDHAAGYLHDAIRNALGEDNDTAKALMARIDKQQEEFKNAGEKADADKVAFYKTMTEQADKAWPAMMGKFDIAEGFDPNNAGALKGKYIKIVSDNLMGYRFKPGDFSYATKINGIAVAGRYDPVVKAALDDAEKKLGRAIGDDDADGKWTVIARVEGTTGQLIGIENRSGDVNVDGHKVGTVEGQVERPVDAPIITIVALKAGPVAVAQGQGAVKEDGSVSAPPAVATASGGHGFSLLGVLIGLVALVVGGVCLMNAKFAPLAGNANAVQMVDKVGAQNLAYLGIAGAALGVIGLLTNLLALPHAFLHAVIGLVASAAMVVAGLLVSRPLLEGRGLLPPTVGAKIAPYAVPAGLACAALGVLTVLMSL